MVSYAIYKVAELGDTMTGQLKHFILAVSMVTLAMPSASALSLYSDASFTYVSIKTLGTYYLTNFGYGYGAGASVGLINLIEADVHYAITIFDNAKFASRVAPAVRLDGRGRVVNEDLYGSLEEILTKRGTITATDFTIVLAPPLVVIKPYAAAGISYSTITLTQLGKPVHQDTVFAPLLRMGARINYRFVFVGFEYRVNTARFNIDLNYDGLKTPIILGGDSALISAGLSF